MDNKSEDYKTGYEQGAADVIRRVSKWLDKDTIEALELEFLGEEI